MSLFRLLSFCRLSLSFHMPIRICRARGLDKARVDVAVRNNDMLASNSRRAYASALKRLSRHLQGCRLGDATFANYIERLHDDRLTAASATMAVKAVRFYCRVERLPRPDGPLTEAALKRFRRESAGRGRGRAEPLLAGDAKAILATAATPRRYADGRREATRRARRRGLLDAALVAVLFLGGMRRSEAAELTWNDVFDSADGQGMTIHVQRSKTNPDGSEPDVRFVNGREADALRRLRVEAGGDRHADRPMFGGLTGATLSRRLAQAARHAGIDKRISGHSGRIGLAVELTQRGASTHDVMHAGNWKSPAMVAHYSAAAQAERGPVHGLCGTTPAGGGVSRSWRRVAFRITDARSSARKRAVASGTLISRQETCLSLEESSPVGVFPRCQRFFNAPGSSASCFCRETGMSQPRRMFVLSSRDSEVYRSDPCETEHSRR